MDPNQATLTMLGTVLVAIGHFYLFSAIKTKGLAQRQRSMGMVRASLIDSAGVIMLVLGMALAKHPNPLVMVGGFVLGVIVGYLVYAIVASSNFS